MTTTTDEASSSSTLILYLSSSLHQLPHVSEVQTASGVGDMSQQLSLNVEPVSCGALPVSSEPLQSYVISPMMSAVQNTLQPANDATSAAANGQLDVTTECVIDVIQQCSEYYDGSSLIQNGLNAEPAEATVLHVEDVGQQPKVSSMFFIVADEHHRVMV